MEKLSSLISVGTSGSVAWVSWSSHCVVFRVFPTFMSPYCLSLSMSGRLYRLLRFLDDRTTAIVKTDVDLIEHFDRLCLEEILAMLSTAESFFWRLEDSWLLILNLLLFSSHTIPESAHLFSVLMLRKSDDDSAIASPAASRNSSSMKLLSSRILCTGHAHTRTSRRSYF